MIDAVNEEDDKVRPHHFFGQVFLITRNLDSREREAVFNGTLPDFACGPEKGPAEHAAVLPEHFDAMYTRKFTR